MIRTLESLLMGVPHTLACQVLDSSERLVKVRLTPLAEQILHTVFRVG
jgi:hypothetical protein